MLAIARALVTDPKVMLLDEPSQGLAPLVVRELAEVIRSCRRRRDHSAGRAEHATGRGGGGRDCTSWSRAAWSTAASPERFRAEEAGNPQSLSDGLKQGGKDGTESSRQDGADDRRIEGHRPRRAEALAAEGVNVILVSRTQADLDVARQTDHAAAGMCAFRCTRSICPTARNVDRLVAEHPDIDILVNNAGAIPGGKLQEINEDRWRRRGT